MAKRGRFRSIEDFLSLLTGVKRQSGGQFMARCPGHADQKASLSVKEADGKILLKCFGGCEVADILKPLNLDVRDLFLDGHKAEAPTQRQIVAVYPYTDANGKPFETVRYFPKDFRQRQPDGKGGYIWNLDGIIPTLYHQDELGQAIRGGKPICILEGEKDVDNLRKLGFEATTNPMGAGKWRASYSETLRGADLVIIPDKDGSGRKHAQGVAQSCYGMASRIRVLELPGPGKDASDWLETGGDRAQLEALAAACPDWTPETAPAAPTPAGASRDESDRELKRTPCARFPGLVDIVDMDGRPGFMLLDDGKPVMMACVDAPAEGKLYVPPGTEHLPFLLPKAAHVQAHYVEDSDGALFKDLVAFFHEVSELPGEVYYYFLAWWTMHTYLYELFDYSPTLSFYAIPERGKSRTGRALASVCYRGIETETLREANLFRWSQDLGAMIFLDVRALWRKAEKAQSEDILLKRYEKGGKVARCIYPDRGAFKDTVYYDIYGPTVIASNEAIHNILETRCIPITMPESSRRFDDNVKPETGLPLKERLVAFRARHMSGRLPDYPKPAPGRLGDILQPIGQVCALVSPGLSFAFKDLVRDIYLQRLESKSESREAQVVLAIEAAADNADPGISIKAVAEAYNASRTEKGATFDRFHRAVSPGFRF